jgi:hypothetical protein
VIAEFRASVDSPLIRNIRARALSSVLHLALSNPNDTPLDCRVRLTSRRRTHLDDQCRRTRPDLDFGRKRLVS